MTPGTPDRPELSQQAVDRPCSGMELPRQNSRASCPFFSELKRRRVGKVAIAYGAVALDVTEACSSVFPALQAAGLDDDVRRRVPAGRLPDRDDHWPGCSTSVRRASSAPSQLSETPRRCRRSCASAYALLVIIAMGGLGYVLYERGVGRAHAGRSTGSIAVLPFTNLSGDASEGLFQRRHVRGAAEPARARAGSAGRIAHFGVRVQEPQRRYPRRSVTSSGSRRCSRVACARPATRCGSRRS